MTKKKMISLKEIKEIVESVFEVDIKERNRKTYVVFARHTYCKLSFDNTKLSLQVIGDEINRNHASVLNSNKKHEGLMATRQIFLENYEKCRDLIIIKKNENSRKHGTKKRSEKPFNTIIRLNKRIDLLEETITSLRSEKDNHQIKHKELVYWLNLITVDEVPGALDRLKAYANMCVNTRHLKRA